MSLVDTYKQAFEELKERSNYIIALCDVLVQYDQLSVKILKAKGDDYYLELEKEIRETEATKRTCLRYMDLITRVMQAVEQSEN
jgi:hypothetical protein